MYSVVLLAALTAGENMADFGWKGGYGGAHSCYGGCYGSCYGGWAGSCYGWSSRPYYGGCVGPACHGGCYGGCYGGGCYGGFGGCYGGGCWGAPYAGYGPLLPGYGCAGGCGGYLSPAYGVPGPVITGPKVIGQGPAVGTPGTALTQATGDRARLNFTLPEGAKLFVEGVYIERAATLKSFRTPPLDPAKNYVYTVRVEVLKDGEAMYGEMVVNVRAGRTEDLDLTAVSLRRVIEPVSR